MKKTIRIFVKSDDYISSLDLRVNFFTLKSMPILTLVASAHGVSLLKLNSVLCTKHCDTNIVLRSKHRKKFVSDLNHVSSKYDKVRVVGHCESFPITHRASPFMDFSFDDFEFVLSDEFGYAFSYQPKDLDILKDKKVKEMPIYISNKRKGTAFLKRKKVLKEVHPMHLLISMISPENCNLDFDLEEIDEEEEADLKEQLKCLEDIKEEIRRENEFIVKRPPMGLEYRTVEEIEKYNQYEKLLNIDVLPRNHRFFYDKLIKEHWPKYSQLFKDSYIYAQQHKCFPENLLETDLPLQIERELSYFCNNSGMLDEYYSELLRVDEVKLKYTIVDKTYKDVLKLGWEEKQIIKNEPKIRSRLSEIEKLRETKIQIERVKVNNKLLMEEKERKLKNKHVKLKKKSTSKKLSLRNYAEISFKDRFPIQNNMFSALEEKEVDLLEKLEMEDEDDFYYEHKDLQTDSNYKTITPSLEDYEKTINLIEQVKNPEEIFCNTKVLMDNMEMLGKGKISSGKNKIPKRRGRHYFSLIAKIFCLIREKRYFSNVDKDIHFVRGCTIKYAMKSFLQVSKQVDFELLKISQYIKQLTVL